MNYNSVSYIKAFLNIDFHNIVFFSYYFIAVSLLRTSFVYTCILFFKCSSGARETKMHIATIINVVESLEVKHRKKKP